MTTVRELLEQSGLDTYTINSLDPQVTGALQNVLSKAEQDKISVDSFWANTYAPGISQWESERGDLARKLARAESEKAALERERQVLVEQGVVTGDNFARDNSGRFVADRTPGTPTFSGDPSEFIGRAAQGFNQILDISHRHQLLYGKPMEIQPSALISEADRLGISPSEYAERRFGFSKRESEIQAQKQNENEERIRADERSKVMNKYSDGATGSINPMATNNSMASIRRATESGERKDPLKLDAAGRRKQALESIHRAIEERAQRDS